MNEGHVQAVDTVEAVTQVGVVAPHPVDCGRTEGHE